MRFFFVPALTLSALGYLTPTPSRSAALDDPTIVAIFDAANTYDIETGQVALQKSGTKAVRDLAQ
jgi:predicted outer membrane protein